MDILENYVSPITVYSKLVSSELEKQEDEYIMTAVREIYPAIDKEELLKALAYDRDQYHKGFNDGYAEALRIMAAEKEELDEL